MPSDPTPTGLRQRKKDRTRSEIRAQALRLFDEQGYARTTTEQIAEAAQVSPSTLFRYFPTKERIVLSEDLAATMLTAFAEQPVDLPVPIALRRAIALGLGQLEREYEQRRRHLISTVPELRAAQLDDIKTTITRLSEAVADRLGRDRDDFEVRVFTGALSGAVMAAIRSDPPAIDDITRAIDYLHTGFPLTATGDVPPQVHRPAQRRAPSTGRRAGGPA